MQIRVTDYDVVRILTNDKILCQNWKAFAVSLGLENELDMLERKYFHYTPIEEISMLIMEKWEAEATAQLPDLLKILNDLGHFKCREEIQAFALKVARSGSRHLHSVSPEYIQLKIPANATGFSYKRVFGDYLDASVTRVVVQDPHLQSSSQINNLDLFLSLLLEKCPYLRKIYIFTSFDDRKDKSHIRKLQMETLAGFATKLKSWTKESVNLVVSYDQELYLQDRNIELDNGWNFFLENGLDFYYTVDQNTESWTDLEIRKTKASRILYHRS